MLADLTWQGAHSWVRKSFNIDMEGEQTSACLSSLSITWVPDLARRNRLHLGGDRHNPDDGLSGYPEPHRDPLPQWFMHDHPARGRCRAIVCTS